MCSCEGQAEFCATILYTCTLAFPLYIGFIVLIESPTPIQHVQQSEHRPYQSQS